MMGLSRSKSWILFVSISLSLGFSACSGKSVKQPSYSEEIQMRKPDPSKVSEGQGVRLSEALKKSISTEAMTPERTRLLAFIQKAQAKKKGRSDDKTYAQCQKLFKNAPECSFVKSDWIANLFDDEEELDANEAEVALKTSQRASPGKMNKQAKKQHSKVVSHLLSQLRQGKIEKVQGQIEGDYYRSLKTYKEWGPELELLAKNVLASSACLDPEFYAYLGLKSEEFFPNDERMKTSTALYSKADQCFLNSPLNKYVQLARFRLGLISVVQKNCEQAQSVFTRLSKMGPSDYSSRALYWNAYCARMEEKKDEFLASFDELFRMNPLGYHTLSINNGDSILISNISKPIDPIVKTRTQKDGQLNHWIRLIEDFDRVHDDRSVYLLLTPVRKTPEFLMKLEPGVRLYLATFAYRSKDMISLFRMLDSVFRTQSEYVVDSTLRLFYPLRHVEKILAGAKKVNPLLIASLIRQESAFQDLAYSRVGAVGLMQLMPATAKLVERKVKRKDLMKPEVNIRIGIRYFEGLVDRYNGDVELALAAYNAGAEVVDRWQKRYPTKNRLLFLDLIPFAETRNYVTLIGRNYYWYSKIYAEQMKKDSGIAQSNETEFRGLKSQ